MWIKCKMWNFGKFLWNVNIKLPGWVQTSFRSSECNCLFPHSGAYDIAFWQVLMILAGNFQRGGYILLSYLLLLWHLIASIIVINWPRQAGFKAILIAVDMSESHQTKCKTCFGGPRIFLSGFWKKSLAPFSN